MRTASDVIKDWKVIQSGRTRFEGQEPFDDEIMLAEVLALREAVSRLLAYVLIAESRAATVISDVSKLLDIKEPTSEG